MMTTYDYQSIENLLLRLLGLLLEIFTNSERNEVQDFIDAGEYELALDTLVDIVIEENKQIPGESLALVCELAELMQLDKKVFEEKLRGHVTDS
ncbi:MafI family immunity protein [Ketobacter sp.]